MNNHEEITHAARVLALSCVYVAGVVLANVLTQIFGLVQAPFGLFATAGTYAAGIVLVFRNLVQDVAGKRAVLILMAAGVILSWMLASPALATASAAAFLLSELSDMSIYTPLRRSGMARAVLVASSVGAIVDTVVFLWIAGFPVMVALPGQLLIKIGMAAVASIILKVGGYEILRKSFDADGS